MPDPMPPLPARIQGDSSQMARKARYEENRAYYASEQTALVSRRGRRRTISDRNLEALIIDTTSAYMGTVDLTYGEDDQSTAWETYLRQVLDRNGGERAALDADIAATVDGDGAWKVTWDAEEHRIRVTIVDPATLWVQSRPDDVFAVDLCAQQYQLTAAAAAEMFPAYTGDIHSNAPIWVTEAWTAETLELWFAGELVTTEPNAIGEIPYVIYPNTRDPHTFWGKGETERFHNLQDTYNSANDDQDRMMELASNIVVVTGLDDAGGDISVMPGALWQLPEEAKATVLDMLTGNAALQRIAALADIRSGILQLAKLPEVAIGSGQRPTAISGLALQIELGPLFRHIERKRLYRADALRARARIIGAYARLYDGQSPPDIEPSVVWKDAIPADRTTDLSNAEAEQRLGRDMLIVLRNIGSEDPQAELDARAAQDAKLAEQAAVNATKTMEAPTNGRGPDPEHEPVGE